MDQSIELKTVCANCGGKMEWIQKADVLQIVRCPACVKAGSSHAASLAAITASRDAWKRYATVLSDAVSEMEEIEAAESALRALGEL